MISTSGMTSQHGQL